MSNRQRAMNIFEMDRQKFITRAMLADASDRSARDKHHAAEQAWSDGIERSEIGAPAEIFEKADRGKCSRCGNERKTTTMLAVQPRYSPLMLSLPDGLADGPIPTQAEQVCGECINDTEIAMILGPAVEYILGVYIDGAFTQVPETVRRAEWVKLLERVRAIFAVRGIEGNRAAAVRALGLGGE